MATYHPGEVNCGHCNEPTGIPADDWAGETRADEDNGYIVSVDPCVRREVHTYGALDRCPDDCPDCAENNAVQGVEENMALIPI